MGISSPAFLSIPRQFSNERGLSFCQIVKNRYIQTKTSSVLFLKPNIMSEYRKRCENMKYRNKPFIIVGTDIFVWLTLVVDY